MVATGVRADCILDLNETTATASAGIGQAADEADPGIFRDFAPRTLTDGSFDLDAQAALEALRAACENCSRSPPLAVATNIRHMGNWCAEDPNFAWRRPQRIGT